MQTSQRQSPLYAIAVMELSVVFPGGPLAWHQDFELRRMALALVAQPALCLTHTSLDVLHIAPNPVK